MLSTALVNAIAMLCEGSLYFNTCTTYMEECAQNLSIAKYATKDISSLNECEQDFLLEVCAEENPIPWSYLNSEMSNGVWYNPNCY